MGGGGSTDSQPARHHLSECLLIHEPRHSAIALALPASAASTVSLITWRRDLDRRGPAAGALRPCGPSPWPKKAVCPHAAARRRKCGPRTRSFSARSAAGPGRLRRLDKRHMPGQEGQQMSSKGKQAEGPYHIARIHRSTFTQEHLHASHLRCRPPSASRRPSTCAGSRARVMARQARACTHMYESECRCVRATRLHLPCPRARRKTMPSLRSRSPCLRWHSC